jgi:transcriptional regulator with XRE-family HTH domain
MPAPDSSAVLAALGTVLRRYREAEGVSQEALGHRVGVHRNHVGQTERAEIVPSFVVVWKLAEGLGVSPSALVGAVEAELAK